MKLKKMYAMLVMLMLFGAVVPAITMARGLGVEGDTIVDAENIDEIDREVDQNIQRKADLDKTTLEDGEDEHPKGEFPDERASKEERIRDVDTPNLIELEGERKKIEKEDITKEKRDVFALPESGFFGDIRQFGFQSDYF